MHFDLKYGTGTLPLDLDDKKIVKVVMPGHKAPLADPQEALRQALLHPDGTQPLLDMLKKVNPQRLVIVINDITRPTPYSALMPPLLEVIGKAGIPDSTITLITATGIHDSHSPEQDRLAYGEEICSRFKIVTHDASEIGRAHV